MPDEKGLDMSKLNYEQATRIGTTFALGMFLADFGKVGYEGARQGGQDVELDEQGWNIVLRQQPTPRIQIRTIESKMYAVVRDALLSIGYEVRDKKDHLVIIL